MIFPAKYSGICPDCDEPIEVGDEIKYQGQFTGAKVIHVQCPEVKEPKTTKFQGTTLEEMGF